MCGNVCLAVFQVYSSTFLSPKMNWEEKGRKKVKAILNIYTHLPKSRTEKNIYRIRADALL